MLVLENRLLAGANPLVDLLGATLWDGTPVGRVGAEGPYWRPLMLADLWLDRQLFGLDPFFFRLHGLLWYAAATLLLARLVLRRVGDGLVTGLAVGVVTVHPAVVEAVLWPSARGDVLATCLVLGAVVALDGDDVGPGRITGGALLVALACAAKESALVAPVLVALVAWGRGARPASMSILGATVGVAVALAVRVTGGAGLPAAGHLLDRLPEALAALAWLGRMLVFPHQIPVGLHLAWPDPIPWGALAGLLLLAVVVGGAGGRLAVAGLAWTAVALVPALAGAVEVGQVGSRFLLLPLAGCAFAVAAVLARHPDLCWGGAVLLATLVPLTGGEVAAWRDDETLWQTAQVRRPTPYTATGLARAWESQGRFAEAAHGYASAVEPPDPFEAACFNVTRSHLAASDPAGAVREGRRALQVGCDPSAELLAPLAVALAVTGEWDEADRIAGSFDTDPTGLAGVVRAAAAWRRGDESTLATAPAGLRDRVAWLLETSGEADAGAPVRRMGTSVDAMVPAGDERRSRGGATGR